MKKSVIVVLGIVFYILFFSFSTIMGWYHYNDPDSHYYLSMTEHKTVSDGTVLGFIAYNFGLSWTQIFLCLVSLLTIFLFYDTIKDERYSEYVTLLFMFSPFIMFMESWYGKLDKNIIELFLFMIFITINLAFLPMKGMTRVIRDKEMRLPMNVSGIVPGKMIHIHRYYIYFAAMVVFIPISYIFWQGSMIFMIYAILFFVVHELFIKDDINIPFYMKCLLTSVLGLLMVSFYYMNRYTYIGVNEMTLTIWNLINPEIIAFILLLLLFCRQISRQYPSFMLMCIITLIGGALMPRLMIFYIPLFYMLMIKIIRHSDSKRLFLGFMVMIFMFVVLYASYIPFFQDDMFKDIKSFPDPCKTENMTDCMIFSDWSYGYVYHDTWNESVYFVGNPNDIPYLLDMMYYKNLTLSCLNCIYLYHPDDYARYDHYAESRGYPWHAQDKHAGIYYETDAMRSRQ